MFLFKKDLWAAGALILLVVTTTSSCSIKFPNSAKNVQQTTSGNSAVPAPILSPTSFNSTDNDYLAVSLYLDPDSPTGTQIYYTTDGSDPVTSVNALEYVLPVAITSAEATVTLRAIAKNGTTVSTEVTGSYWFGDWEIVGTTYPTPSASGSPAAIFVDNNVPYIAHIGTAPHTFEVEKLVAGAWTPYPAITGCDALAGGNSPSYLFVESGTPYIACYGSGNIYVKEYTSGAWHNIGSALSYNPLEVSLYVENATPYIAIIDASGQNIYVFYHNGTAWTQLGSSAGKSTKVFLKVKNGTPYVGINQLPSPTVLAFKKFDGTSWTTLGNIGASPSPTTWDFDFTVYDDGSTDGKVYVIYNNVGLHFKEYINGTWNNLPQIAGTSAASFPTLNVKGDIPYVSYVDGSGHAVIKRFYTGTWSDVGTPSYYGNVDAPDSFIADDGTIYSYYSTIAVSPEIGLVESFGPGGSGILAHVDDPLQLN